MVYGSDPPSPGQWIVQCFEKGKEREKKKAENERAEMAKHAKD